MKSFLTLMIVLLLAGFACSKASGPESVSVDGIYQFDADVFMQNINKSEDPVFKNMPKDVVEKTVTGLKTFTLEIKGNEATANFSNVVVKGNLQKIDTQDGTMKFMMTPVDEDKKQDAVTIIIEGGKLTLDPGKEQMDKLFFRKAS